MVNFCKWDKMEKVLKILIICGDFLFAFQTAKWWRIYSLLFCGLKDVNYVSIHANIPKHIPINSSSFCNLKSKQKISKYN